MLTSRALLQRFVRVPPPVLWQEAPRLAFSCRRCRHYDRQLSTTTTTSQRAARVVVLGSGRMGQIRTALLQANPRFQVQGIVDSNLTSAVALAEKYGVRCCFVLFFSVRVLLAIVLVSLFDFLLILSRFGLFSLLITV